jgi:hypothetical protein
MDLSLLYIVPPSLIDSISSFGVYIYTKAMVEGSDFKSWQWIDSYCIGKASIAELSEAINSKFRWYQNAQVCYAYLPNVPAIKYLDHYRDDSESR